MEKSRKVTHKNQPFFYCLLRISEKSPVRTAYAVKGVQYVRNEDSNETRIRFTLRAILFIALRRKAKCMIT